LRTGNENLKSESKRSEAHHRHESAITTEPSGERRFADVIRRKASEKNDKMRL